MTRRTAPAEGEGNARSARAAFSAPPPAIGPDRPRIAAPPASAAAALPPCAPAELDRRLAPLPARALGLDADTARLLDRLGLRTIGALAAVPRPALMRRFADLPAERNPLLLLDRATGRLPEPVDAPPDPRRLVARARLAEPVEDAAPHLPALAEALCAELAKAGRGARLLQLTVYRVDGTWRSAEVATARATRDPAHLRRLLDGRLDRIDPGFGFDLLTLEALRAEPLGARQEGLAGGGRPRAEVDALLDRLTARLGPGRVMWTHWRESHLPERVEVPVPALGARPAAPPVIARERPVRLLDPAEEVRVLYAVPEGPPARFVWRRVPLEVARHEGPERIAPEWWREGPATRLRDYYKVETADGRRLWLYREGVLGDGRGRVVTAGGDAEDRSGPHAPRAARPPAERDARMGGARADGPPGGAADPARPGTSGRAGPEGGASPTPSSGEAARAPGAANDAPDPGMARRAARDGDSGGSRSERPSGRWPPGALEDAPHPGDGPRIAAPAIHTGDGGDRRGAPLAAGAHVPPPPEESVLPFPAPAGAAPAPRAVELAPRWFVQGLFA